MRVARYWRLKEQNYRLANDNNSMLERPAKLDRKQGKMQSINNEAELKKAQAA